jgi:hypothetical protein
LTYLVYSANIERAADNKDYLLKFMLNKAIACSKMNWNVEYGHTIEEVLKLDPKNTKALYHKIKYLVLS